MLDSELECIKSLNHVNLLKCYDTFTTLNNCYIITEYCNEGDLSSKLKCRGKYTEEEFKQVFKQLYLGYTCLNEKGYIHRDLKPANILLKNGVIKIADFGFVKRLTGSTKESYNVGTPLYMSP
jgi:serine/threonine-protein kinase ULK/ATG1